jgi:hypothetical protein
MGLFNDSYNIANGAMRIKGMQDQKQEAAKREAEAKRKAAENAKKSPADKSNEENLFI